MNMIDGTHTPVIIEMEGPTNDSEVHVSMSSTSSNGRIAKISIRGIYRERPKYVYRREWLVRVLHVNELQRVDDLEV